MSSQICRLYIVRHGQSELNRDKKISGHVDPDLTELGRNQAIETKHKLSKVHFDEVYSSDLKRAAETAAIVYGQPVPKTHQLEGLRERSFGPLEAQPEHHLDGVHAAMMALPQDERWLYSHVDGVENDNDLASRFLGAVRTVAEQNMGRTVLIAAHGGSIRVSLIKLGFGTHADLPPRSFKNAGYIELSYDGKDLRVEKVEGIDDQVVAANKRLLEK